MDDIYFYGKDDEKIGRVLMGLKVPFRFEDDIVKAYNNIFDREEERYDRINKRKESSQRQPKFIQWLI